jgi:benzoate-CoA ligase family protein
MEPLNVTTFFLDENIPKGRGNRIAVYCRNEKFSYYDIFTLTNKVGNVFKELGVEIENRVYLTLGDSPELVASFYGAMKIGAVSTLAYTYLSPEDYEHEINYIKPKLIVTDSLCVDRIRKATERTRYPKAVLVLGEPPHTLRKGEYDFQELVKCADDKLEADPTSAEDPALWKFSGGTTGRRKGIPHRHRDPVWAFEAYNQVIGFREDDVVLPVPKMFFGYGRDATIVHPFRLGAAAVLFPERTTVERIFELVKKYQPTILVQVPTMMRKMIETPKEERVDLSCIRVCTSGGEALSADLYNEWKKHFGCEVLNQIGSAEVYYAYISSRPGDVVPGSVGRVVPGFEIKIVNGEGHEVPDGEVGVLMVKGECMGLQYWGDAERSRKTFRGEWLYTGDLFRRDQRGNFYFCGRSDDLLKVSGYFVSPLEIEECLQTHPYVSECAVLGVKDQDGLDQTKAFVVLEDGIEPSESIADELKKYAKGTLSPYKYPRLVEFVGELPKTGLGKVDRLLLKQRGLK